MEFLKLVEKRCSVRKYLSKPVEDEKLDMILEAGRLAPTAANFQPVKVIAVRNKESLEKIGRAADIYGAPLALIVLADRSKAWTRPFDKIIDASIVTDHMMLEATSLGLGSVWICYFKPDILREEFNIPENLIPVNILAVGYSSEDIQKAPKIRNPIDSFVCYEKL